MEVMALHLIVEEVMNNDRCLFFIFMSSDDVDHFHSYVNV